jgi:hypothetical protein
VRSCAGVSAALQNPGSSRAAPPCEVAWWVYRKSWIRGRAGVVRGWVKRKAGSLRLGWLPSQVSGYGWLGIPSPKKHHSPHRGSTLPLAPTSQRPLSDVPVPASSTTVPQEPSVSYLLTSVDAEEFQGVAVKEEIPAAFSGLVPLEADSGLSVSISIRVPECICGSAYRSAQQVVSILTRPATPHLISHLCSLTCDLALRAGINSFSRAASCSVR